MTITAARAATQGSIDIALIGLGKIARDQHVPAIAADPRFRLVATVDPHARLDGVAGFGSLDGLIADGPPLEAVAICTPPAIRAGLAQRAIAAGWHVLLEKPPVAKSNEAAAIERQAAAAGVTLFAAWHSQMAGGVAPARAWLADRAVTSLDLQWREDIRRWHPGQDWLLAAGGFGVFDPAINAFSILTAILASPIAIDAARLIVPRGRDEPIAGELSLRIGDAPGRASLDFLYEGAPRWEIAIETAAGSLRLSDGGQRIAGEGIGEVDAVAEYPALYSRFADLVAARESEVDLAPLLLVEQAMRCAAIEPGPHFDW
ncbi:Gfo/Idh/MocA family oxidoreductase [Sphingomonas sp. ASV193]|uniref:Gfo/Idh/MocA family protein n=1 Tax=Sphingomonas sp. ASV193 TaxID=3144405 RepID=UPI0032E8ED98